MAETMYGAYTSDEITEACRLLLEMRENCLRNPVHGEGEYNDPKRLAKAKALNIALDAIDRMEPANDGRMLVNTNKIKENTKMDVMAMDRIAQQMVIDYTWEHLDKSDDIPQGFGVFIVWKAKILQNWKFLLSTTLFDGMYYELTYNGDKDEWYLDAYKKFENRCIDGDAARYKDPAYAVDPIR